MDQWQPYPDVEKEGNPNQTILSANGMKRWNGSICLLYYQVFKNQHIERCADLKSEVA